MERVRTRIVKGVTYRSLEKISIQVLSLVAFFIIINNISLKGFGIITLLFTFIAPATTLATLGVERLVVADIAVYRAKQAYSTIRKLIREYFSVSLTILLVLFLISWFLKDLVNQYYTYDLLIFYWALVFLIVGQYGMNFAGIIFESYEKFAHLFFLKAGEAFVRTAIVISFFFWIGFTLQSVIWAYIIGKLAVTLVSIPFAIWLVREGGGEISDESVLKGVLRRHGKWEMVSTMIKTAVGNISPWIINFLVSVEGVALYAFVMKINSVISAVLPVRATLFPILSHSIGTNKKLAITIATKIKKYLFIFYGVLYIVGFFAVGYLIAWFAPQYGDAENLVRLAMLRLFIDTLSLGQSVAFYALKKQKLNFFMNLQSNIVQLVLQVALTYYLGVAGLILSGLFASLNNVILREYLLRKYLQLPMIQFKGMFTFDEHDRMVLQSIKKKLHK